MRWLCYSKLKRGGLEEGNAARRSSVPRWAGGSGNGPPVREGVHITTPPAGTEQTLDKALSLNGTHPANI